MSPPEFFRAHQLILLTALLIARAVVWWMAEILLWCGFSTVSLIGSLVQWCGRWGKSGGARFPPPTTPLHERSAEGAEASVNSAKSSG